MKKLRIISLITCILIAMVIASCSKEKEVDPEVVVAEINAIFEEEGTQEYLGDIVLGMAWPGREFMTNRGYIDDPDLWEGNGYYHPEKRITVLFSNYPDVIDSERLVTIEINECPVKFLGMSAMERDFKVREDLPEGLYSIRVYETVPGTLVGIELHATNKTDKILDKS